MKQLLLLLLLPACTSDPDQAPDAGPTPDADIVPSTGGDLRGRWRELPPADGDYIRTFSFSADGTFEVQEDPLPVVEGMYTVGDGRVELAYETGEVYDSAYRADGTHLLLVLLEPDDDGADPIATWRSERQTPTGLLSVVIVLGDDGVVHEERTKGDSTEVLDGTWTQREEEIELDLGSRTESYRFYAGFLGRGYEAI